jgi:hypothetical protein
MSKPYDPMRWTNALLAAAVASLAAGCSCSPILGATCRDGLSLCGNACFDLESDPLHCGECDLACEEGRICSMGACVAIPADASIDASIDAGNDASVDAGPRIDAGNDAARMGQLDGGEKPPCELGQILCNEECIDGRSDPDNCGGCEVACAVGEYCVDGACVLDCELPLIACGDRCVDVLNDPDNCGRCANVCTSGICIEGECSEPLAGHVVVIGHDYTVVRRGMARLAGNALFLARGNPVHALVWEGTSSTASRTGSDTAINQVATALGRSWIRESATDPASVPLQLADVDAFVIYAQQGGDDVALRSLGLQWTRALEMFLARGGVIVLFETMTASHQGTWQILDEAGLFECSSRVDSTGT